MRTADLDYNLPPALIASHAAEPRDSARLMVIDRQATDAAGAISHQHVRDLPCYLRAGDLLVVNQSKVLPAYLTATRCATGGHITGLYIGEQRIAGQIHWHVMLESRGKLKPGERIALDESAHLELLERKGGGEWETLLHTSEPQSTLQVLQRIGLPPLPPYIRKARKLRHENEYQSADVERYNTVYARTHGSVAAPTAGLHLTLELLATLDRMGVHRAEVTLHVGLGTFTPVRTDNVEDHPIHSEQLEVPWQTIELLRKVRMQGGRIIPIGTTTVRALESLPDPLPTGAESYAGDTRLFITPDNGFEFRFADGLMTNFHLPRSTLLALVAALPGVGLDRLLGWYAAAIEEQYRFYSFGDAMLIL